MNKSEALIRLTSLENETKELRKIIEAPDVPKDIMERVKTFEDACAITGDNPKSDKFNVGDIDDIAYQKLKVIAKALNEGWIPELKNTNQYKYYPWFKIMGVGLSCHDFDLWYAYSVVGVRLCFKTDKLATYAGKQFTSLYTDWLS